MKKETYQIQMFGRFAIRLGQEEISDSTNRSRKVWLLLAYLVCNRKRHISQEELVWLLWGDEITSANPLNSLKTMFHRARSLLDQLGDHAGHTLIIRSGGSYGWNPEVPVSLDLEDFESLSAPSADQEESLERGLQAVELYQGSFLPKLQSEDWVAKLAEDCHQRYLQTVTRLLPVLESQGRLEAAVSLCRQAVAIEPGHQPITLRLMRDLLDLGERHEAASVYESLSQLLFDSVGTLPTEELQILYREAVRTLNDRPVSVETLQQQLQETDSALGAMICDYDFFKTLYRQQARELARSGEPVHLALISVSGQNGGPLARRSLDRCMENLQNILQVSLRRGDAAARCSLSQFVLLLPKADYENSKRVCTRVTKGFCRQYPHSPAVLLSTVRPLEPF